MQHIPPPTGPVPPPIGNASPDAPSRWRVAPVTAAIVALNVAVFVVQVVMARDARAVSRVPTAESLQFGANYALATIREHRFETLVTACFLHSGILHIALNMLVLWQAGPLVERAVGSARMAPMYLFAGIASSLLSALVSWLGGHASYSVGASGAIMGVLAAALVIGWRVQGWRGPLTQAMVRWLGFNLVFGLLIGVQGGNIDNAAHIGGAIAGAFVATLWKRGVRYSPAATRLVLAGCAAIVLAAGGAVAARSLRDPFAGMLVDERYDEAQAALSKGDCRRAWDALRATERLAPRAAPVRQLRADFDASCRPM